jgi:hypothetical protein
VGKLTEKDVPSNKIFIIPSFDYFFFGILSSTIHRDWLALVGGRLGNSLSYSATVVYNTFPWPSCTSAQRAHIGSLAEEILLAREETFDWTMADMYDPDEMPANLLKAHQVLDQSVERLYRDKPFRDTAERQEYLLARYEQLIEQERRGLTDLAE